MPALCAPREPLGARCAIPESNRGALLRIFTEAREELIGTLWSVLGNREDAQDAAQEAFLRCWRASDALASVRNLRAYLFRTGLNLAKDIQRSAWRRRVLPLIGELPNHLDLDRELNRREQLSRLRDAIVCLGPAEKSVFLLRQNEGLSYEQIAELCQRPIGTVKTQMRSAIRKLREVLARNSDSRLALFLSAEGQSQ